MATQVAGIDAVTSVSQLLNVQLQGQQLASLPGVIGLDHSTVSIDGINILRETIEAGRIDPSTPRKGIVDSVQAVRDKFLTIQNNIEALASKGKDFSSADLLLLQKDVQELGYFTELAVKSADKTSQGAQTLFRNQG